VSQISGPGKPGRRDIFYWAAWAGIIGVVVAVISMCVAHVDADNANGARTVAPPPTTDVSTTEPNTPTSSAFAPTKPSVAPPAYLDELPYIQYIEIGGVKGSHQRGAEVDGVSYPRSVVVDAGCAIRRNFGTFNLSRKYSYLKATLGVEDNSLDGSRFRFSVFADSKLIYRIDLGLGTHREVNIKLGSLRPLRLRLEITSLAKEGTPACGSEDFAVFGDAMVTAS
jgi:hypothetical protein